MKLVWENLNSIKKCLNLATNRRKTLKELFPHLSSPMFASWEQVPQVQLWVAPSLSQAHLRLQRVMARERLWSWIRVAYHRWKLTIRKIECPSHEWWHFHLLVWIFLSLLGPFSFATTSTLLLSKVCWFMNKQVVRICILIPLKNSRW